ncbi:MAG: DEAD/DEAH box helicase family protein, partial [Romboutsia sp.]|nr:DEAD/DEAH box helicase family protein [Romboutsia sp.]
MEKYAKVIVRSNTFHTDNLFTYKIPEFLENHICIGHRVLVPFGKGNKPTEAFVFKICDTLEEDIRTKEIVDILDEDPIFKQEDLELVNWMKNRYLCTYIDCINLIYPKGYKLNNYKVISLSDELLKLKQNEFEDLILNLDEIQRDIIQKIEKSKGSLKVEKLKKIPNINYILDKMSKKNLIHLKWEYKNHKNEKNLFYISLLLDSCEIDKYIKINKISLGSKQKEIISFLKENNKVELNNLMSVLKASKQSILSLQDKNLIKIYVEDYYRNPESSYTLEQKKINLNKEQQMACDKVISEMFDEYKKPYMIHGVTGSGKTEVYMEIIDYALKQGLDGIVLVPEIALTPQTITRFKNRFGDIVGVFHSQLSEGQKHDVYKAIKSGNIRILIGARSALFAPFNSLGVIIIDEFHETSYKSEKNPKFSAIEVAKFISSKNNVSLVLGSATPSIDEYYKAKNGEYNLIEIKQRANK